MHRFVSFLAVYGAINGFRIIRRFADAVTPDQPIYALWMLHSFFGPIQGLGNALVYGCTPRVRRLYAERFPRWCARLAVKHVPTEHAPPTLATSESVASTTNDGGAGGNESL